MRATLICFAFLFSQVAVTAAIAQKVKKEKEKDSVKRDYQKDLPRLQPKSPRAALGSFRVANGFTVQLVASEPLVVDPVAIAFDEHGRLFVVEMRGYSEDGDKNLGRIKLLHDDNQDGKYERFTVYASGLSWPTAVTCYKGGIFVGAPPNIHYFKDSNGDGRADIKKIVYTGFGRGNVQGLLNTFKWGLDNRIHGATSSSGAAVRKVGSKNKKPLVLRGRDFAIEPKSLTLSAVSGGGQHGLSFNQWGEKFVCSNSNHIQYVLFDDRYMSRNPFLATPSARRMIAAEGPQADVFRSSQVEPWRIIRTRLRIKKIVPGPVERGGKAAGYFTGSTGITIYRGNHWDSKYQGWAIIGDVGSNLIHRKRLRRNGVGWIAERVDKKSEFLSSTDTWFRPVQFANGPDGALYVADMYREVIEHPLSLPPVIKRHLDLTSGRNRGRIYRIVQQLEEAKRPSPPRLGKASTSKLVAALEHPNGWHRETAARLLYERLDRAAIPLLHRLVRKSRLPSGRIRALYALRSLSAVTDATMVAALSDKHPRVREHATRIAEPLLRESVLVRERVLQLAADPSLRVRYQVAFSLGELPASPQRSAALSKILRRDGANLDLQLACYSSLVNGAGDVVSHVSKDTKWATSKTGKSILMRLARQIGRQQKPEDIAAVLDVLRERTKNAKDPVVPTLISSLAAKKNSSLALQIGVATGGQSEKVLRKLLQNAATAAANARETTTRRLAAIHLLRLEEQAKAIRVLGELLKPTQPSNIQSAALRALTHFDSPDIARLLVERWSSFTPSVRRQAANAVLSRDTWLPMLFAGLKARSIVPQDLEPGRLKLLSKHRDAKIRALAAPWAVATKSARAKVVGQYQTLLGRLKGRAKIGKQVFKKNCALCHRAQGVGHALAPNIMAMRNRGPESILINVLDPNREVNPRYLNYVVASNEARIFSGMIEAESATSVTLTRAEKQSDTILRIDIETMRSTGLSLMPEGMEKQVKPQAMADLIAYLMSL